MEKHTAIRTLPGSRVVFRGMLHEVVSIKSAGGMDGPYFRLRNLEHGTPTDLVSYKFLALAQSRGSTGLEVTCLPVPANPRLTIARAIG
jgi:hypothetical protein